MKNTAFIPMGQEIPEDEFQIVPQTKPNKISKSSQKVKDSLKNLKTHFKKPHMIILIIILFIIILLYLALNLISQKQKNQPTQSPQTQASPSTQQTPDQSLQSIKAKVDSYSQKVDNLSDYQNKLTYPIVDLDINFQKQ